MKANENKYVTTQEALSTLVEKFATRQQIHTGSFSKFVRDVWSRGYERPELFSTWHVQLMCSDLEQALKDGKNYLAKLPRYHLKSTILGHAATIWYLLNAPRDMDALYLSYSDTMSQWHISEINKRVRGNPILNRWMEDRSPEADFSFRYVVNGKRIQILHGGLFSFKRGLHVNGPLIADDILRDPDNPLNLSQLDKIERHFLTESLFIPNKGAPTIVLGTPMAPDDLLDKLQSDERFLSRVLPALNPTPEHAVLCPEIMSEQELLNHQKQHPSSFASEFMLMPYLSTQSYFSDADLHEVENNTLISLNPNAMHKLDKDFVVAGCDVGKKRHPSHVAIYVSRGGRMYQVFHMFLDGWAYTRQIQFLNQLVENFQIDKGYVDNTRGEFEERGLAEVWHPLSFTAKSKMQMAQIFEEYIHTKRIEMIPDHRQRSQITSVDASLKAAETPMGHGDAFFSNALAALAHSEMTRNHTRELGDMNDLFPSIRGENENKVDDSLKKAFDKIFSPLSNQLTEKCPKCSESAGWIPERQLCLICKQL